MAEHDNWDTHWDRYAASASLNPAQQMRHGLVARLLQEAKGTGPMRVLDFGSGQGDFFVKLRPELPAAELAGFELSESGVAISRKKIPDAKFLVVDLFKPPAEASAFRGWATHAICSEVLEHVDSPVEFLKAASPYLAPGAKIVITVPGGPMSAFDHHIGHRQHFTRGKIGTVLESAGFRVEKVNLSGFPFFNLYRLIVIARGKRLAADVETSEGGATTGLAGFVMSAFRVLFRLNLTDFPLGWQVVAVATKP